MRSFWIVARPLEFLWSFKLRLPLLEVPLEHQDSFPDEARKGTLILRWSGKNGALLEFWQDPRCFSRVEAGMLGNFFSGIKGVKDPFEASEGQWEFSWDTAEEKGLISPWGENLLIFLELRQETWGSSRVTTGSSGTRSCCLRQVKSPCELRRTSWDCSPVCTQFYVLNWCWGRNLRLPLQCWPGSQGSYGVLTGESGLISCGVMEVRFPLEL